MTCKYGKNRLSRVAIAFLLKPSSYKKRPKKVKHILVRIDSVCRYN